MNESRLLTVDGETHFMTKRFDRDGSRRYHVQTLCALQHLPPGGPRELYSYETLFETAEALSLGYEEREEIFVVWHSMCSTGKWMTIRRIFLLS